MTFPAVHATPVQDLQPGAMQWRDGTQEFTHVDAVTVPERGVSDVVTVVSEPEREGYLFGELVIVADRPADAQAWEYTRRLGAYTLAHHRGAA